MSLDFPSSPSNGDVHNGFIYDSTLGVWDVATSSGKFAVTAGSGIYIFNGSGTSSDNNPTLYLTRGETYEFEIDANGHPFYIKTSNSTGTGNAYSDGVTNNGTQSGTITFTVQMDAPDTLHYNCQYHSAMNGPIYILDRVHAINDLSDVDTSTAAPTNGQALVWDSSAGKWEPGTVSGGGSYSDSDVDSHLNTGTANANEVLSWTGSDYDWVAQSGGGGGASVSVSDSAPSNPSAGDLWWDSSQAMMFIYYADGSSNQWVKANPSGSGGADIAVQETAPSNPASGDLWFDPATLKTYVYYNDGDSAQWVQSNPTGGGGSGGGSSVTVSDTAPSSPSAGDLWWHSTNLKLYVYYTDGSSNQWVQTNPSGTVSLGVDDLTDVDTTTAAPSTGDLLQWNGTKWVPYTPTFGITEIDQWRLTADITSDVDPISSNLERVDDPSFSKLGTGMSVSSGVWTFPSTGLWEVGNNLMVLLQSSDPVTTIRTYVSIDNGANWDEVATTRAGYGGSTAWYQGNSFSFVNVTNTTNVKVKFTAASIASGNQIKGSTDTTQTHFTFKRLGDSQ